jgi:hypothetical protein
MLEAFDRGAHPHAVLCHHAQGHELALEQRGDAAGELRIEPRAMAHPEVRQRVVIDPDPAADPAVRVVALAQPIELARRAHPVDSCPQPQRHQDRRVDRRPPGRALDRPDPGVQRRQIERPNERPDRAHRMIGAQERVQIARPQLDLIALRRHHSGSPGSRRLRRLASTTLRQLAGVEQRRHLAGILSSIGFGAHAPIIRIRSANPSSRPVPEG